MEQADADLLKSHQYAQKAARLPEGHLLKQAYLELARAYRAAAQLSSLAKEVFH